MRKWVIEVTAPDEAALWRALEWLAAARIRWFTPTAHMELCANWTIREVEVPKGEKGDARK